MSHNPNQNRITAFSVGGFRSISSEKPATLPLDGVTALCGLNSAGKSSALYALRLLAQSLECEPYGANLHFVGRLANRSEFRTVDSLFHRSDSVPRISFRLVSLTNEGWENHEFLYGLGDRQEINAATLPLHRYRRFRLSLEGSSAPDPWSEMWGEGCVQDLRRVDSRELFSRVTEEVRESQREPEEHALAGALGIWNASLAVPEGRMWVSLPGPGKSAQEEYADVYEEVDLERKSSWDSPTNRSLVCLSSTGSRALLEYPWLECLAGWSDMDDVAIEGGPDWPGQIYGDAMSYEFDSETKELCWDYLESERLGTSPDLDEALRPGKCRASLAEVAEMYRDIMDNPSKAERSVRESHECYDRRWEVLLFAGYFFKLQEEYSNWSGRDLGVDCKELLSMSECEFPAHLDPLTEIGPLLWVSYLLSGFPKNLVSAPTYPIGQEIFLPPPEDKSEIREREQQRAENTVKREEKERIMEGLKRDRTNLKQLLAAQADGIPPVGLFFPVKENQFRRALSTPKPVSGFHRGLEENPIAESLGASVRNLLQQLSIRSAPGIRNPLESERGDVASLVAQISSVGHQQCEFPLPDGEVKSPVTVLDALNQWLDHLGLSEVHHFENDLRGATVAVMKMDADDGPGMLLDDQGEGMRQIIYILIQALLARPGDVLVWQQPEVHLHPSAEARMAEFALALEEFGVRVIVETHSTHFLDGLRLSSLEKCNSLRPSATGLAAIAPPVLDILFFSRPNGSSLVQKVELDKYGQIKNWPIGFLDERQDLDRRLLESYILAQRVDNQTETGQE